MVKAIDSRKKINGLRYYLERLEICIFFGVENLRKQLNISVMRRFLKLTKKVTQN